MLRKFQVGKGRDSDRRSTGGKIICYFLCNKNFSVEIYTLGLNLKSISLTLPNAGGWLKMINKFYYQHRLELSYFLP